MQIVSVEERHFSAWLAMRMHLYSGVKEIFHRREMSLITSSETFHCFVVEDSARRALGFVELSLRNIVDGVLGGPVGYIEGLYLDTELRGRGLGRALLEEASDWFRAHGCTHVGTDTEFENEAAQKYFEGQGFSRQWTIVQYLKEIP